MVGPSASGSENGTPTSTKSAPAAATSRSASSDASGVGNPAVRYGMSAARRVPAFPRMARQRAAIGCSDKVVADVDAVLYGVRDLHDRAGMIAFGVALREVGEESGVLHPAFGRGHDADDRSMHVGDVRIGADRKSTRLNSSHGYISYAVFCLKKKKKKSRKPRKRKKTRCSSLL